jgi:hypothetical protein
MIALERARTHLEQLGMSQAAALLDARLQTAAQRQISYADLLADLLEADAEARRQDLSFFSTPRPEKRDGIMYFVLGAEYSVTTRCVTLSTTGLTNT